MDWSKVACSWVDSYDADLPNRTIGILVDCCSAVAASSPNCNDVKVVRRRWYLSGRVSSVQRRAGRLRE